MDIENDLEEQLTSYHICKLPTSASSSETPTSTESDSVPARKKAKIADTTNRVPIGGIGLPGKASNGSDYRLEVFTVESAQQSPPLTLQDSPERTRGHVVNTGSEITVLAGESPKVWYQLPALAPLTQQIETPALPPTRVSARVTKGQTPLRLLDLPDKAPVPVIQHPPGPQVQTSTGKSQIIRQSAALASPVVSNPVVIKIEDDDEQPAAPANATVQPVVEAPRHVIKLLTSVPVSKYPCEFCGTTFTLWNQRENHMNSQHRINGLFTCFVCQQAAREYYITNAAIFSTPHYHFLQAHLADSHKITGQPRGFQCPYCSLHPANYEALVKHLTSVHDTSALGSSLLLVNVLEDRIDE
ncbi:uncharacterized protein LOC132262090 [Phlebotomus argentipes]|uniref:uncharacterized protein LOC132262090 n=1 Tax=Phlebotomus argentipes TaxID=94469 RepID=UPI0028930128|nr:uncharacterized protein LOC132262090 [Phlebotomus argentipes]